MRFFKDPINAMLILAILCIIGVLWLAIGPNAFAAPAEMTSPPTDFFDGPHIKYGTYNYHGVAVTVAPKDLTGPLAKTKCRAECTRYSPGAATALIETMDDVRLLDHALACHVDNDPKCAHHGDWPAAQATFRDDPKGVSNAPMVTYSTPCARVPGSDGKTYFDSPQTCMGWSGMYEIPGRSH
jgi:hypothetical protein